MFTWPCASMGCLMVMMRVLMVSTTHRGPCTMSHVKYILWLSYNSYNNSVCRFIIPALLMTTIKLRGIK